MLRGDHPRNEEEGPCQQQQQQQQFYRSMPLVNGYAVKHPAKQIRDSTMPLRVPPPVDLITDIGLVVVDQPQDIWVRY
jgi:hypothetical protein